MKKIIALAFAVITVFTVSSCKKNVDEGNTSYKLIISCHEINENLNDPTYGIKKSKIELIPKNGIILEASGKCDEEESVFDVFVKHIKDEKLHYEAQDGYVTAVANIYTGDCGPFSGWMFFINDSVSMTGATDTSVNEGDVIEFRYIVDYNKVDYGFTDPASDTKDPAITEGTEVINKDLKSALEKLFDKKNITSEDLAKVNSIEILFGAAGTSEKSSSDNVGTLNVTSSDKNKIVSTTLKDIDLYDDLKLFSELESFSVGDYTKDKKISVDINMLTQNNNLKKLELFGVEVQNFDKTESLQNLEILIVYSDSIKDADVSGLEKLSFLKTLSITSKNITDISFVEDLVNLEIVCIDGGNLEILPSFDSLEKLSIVDFSNNKIKDISQLSVLDNSKVEFVNLLSNPISDLSPLNHIDSDKIIFDLEDTNQ